MSLKIIVAEFAKFHIFIAVKNNEIIDLLFINEHELNYNSIAFVELNNKLLALDSFYASNSVIKEALVAKNKTGSLQKSLLCHCVKVSTSGNKLPLLKKGIVLNGYFCCLSYGVNNTPPKFIFKGFKEQELLFSLNELNCKDFTVEFNKNTLKGTFAQIKYEIDYLKNFANNILANQSNILLLQQNPIFNIINNKNEDIIELIFENSLLKNTYYSPLVSNIIKPKKVVVNKLQASNIKALELKNEILLLKDKNIFISKNLTIKLHETEDFSYFDLNGNVNNNPLDFNFKALKEVKNFIYKRVLCGQILVDLVNLKSKDDKITFLKLARELFANDSNIIIAGVSKFSILEISRKRMFSSIQSIFCHSSINLNNQANAILCLNDINFYLNKNPSLKISCCLCQDTYNELIKILNKNILNNISFNIASKYQNGNFKVFVK